MPHQDKKRNEKPAMEIPVRRVKELQDDTFFDSSEVASATECTGLQTTPPTDPSQAEAYQELYDVPLNTAPSNHQLQEEHPER